MSHVYNSVTTVLNLKNPNIYAPGWTRPTKSLLSVPTDVWRHADCYAPTLQRKGGRCVQVDQGSRVASNACIIPLCLPPLQCHFVSFLSSHVPFFILDLLSWWWWVSLYNMKLRVRNTKQKWDRFSTLLGSGGSLPVLVHCAVHPSWTWTVFCAFVRAMFVLTSGQSVRFHPLTLSSLHYIKPGLFLYYSPQNGFFFYWICFLYLHSSVALFIYLKIHIIWILAVKFKQEGQ